MEDVATMRADARPAGPEAWDDAVTRLFAREATTLVRLARFFVDDRAAAEDLVQEAFIKLSRSLHALRDDGAATAYLRVIVLNLARDHNRRGLMSLRHRPPAAPEPPSLDEQVAGRDDARAVVAAVRALPKRQRDCVVLRYYLELPVADVARTLDLSVNSVKTHLKRALATLGVALHEVRDSGAPTRGPAPPVAARDAGSPLGRDVGEVRT